MFLDLLLHSYACLIDSEFPWDGDRLSLCFGASRIQRGAMIAFIFTSQWDSPEDVSIAGAPYLDEM